jgi:small subunit ribosomal protein S8e
MATRKISGGKYKKLRKRKLYETPGRQQLVLLRQTKKKIKRIMGGTKNTILLRTDIVNIIDPKTKKSQKATIKNVSEVPSNRFLARKNVLVKGAIIETSIGKARITNRPSREPTVEAVLI